MNQRELKFRAWDKFNKEWAGIVIGKEMAVSSFKKVCDLSEWMQFTGLHDKNGKEIYEGDIVVRERENVGHDKKRVVHWRIGNGVGFNLRDTSRILIIGNVYENPELLNN